LQRLETQLQRGLAARIARPGLPVFLNRNDFSARLGLPPFYGLHPQE
jgi:hypothetical protein